MITITETLDLLTSHLDTLKVNDLPKHHEALRLAIKGLERFRGLRAVGHYVGMPLLKGEKEE